MTKVYRHALSGHSHRVELFLSLIGREATLVDVDLLAGAQKAPEFLAKNVFGQVPVLEEDDGTTLADANAILVYLALKYADAGWYPRDPKTAAEVQRWLSVAAGQINAGPGAARLVKLFGLPLDHARAVQVAEQLFQTLETHLTGRSFLAADHATIADVAGYSYIALAPEGEVSLEPYPNIRAWLARIEALPGFKPVQRTPAH